MMDTIIVLLVVGLVARTLSFEACSENLYPPIWRTVNANGVSQGGSVLIGEDKESGCVCREFPASYSFCFGRDTCRSFPKNVRINTNNFQLKSSQITTIKPGSFGNFTHLEALSFEGNYNLTRVVKRSFVNMTMLKLLSISHNPNFKTLEEGCFDGLDNLERLYLVKNAFVTLSEVTSALRTLPKLIKVVLSENNFKTMKREFDVMRDSPLQELDLVLCQIESMEPGAFNSLTNLTALRLGENNFNSTTITRVVEEAVKHVPLRSLNLYSVGLRKNTAKELLRAIGNSNITILCLARNQFEEITSEMFPKMPNLEVLDLRSVLALNITNDAFVGLPKLNTLLLNDNKLASIPEGVLLEQLKCLDLQQNSGNRFSSSYFSIYGEKFTNMKNLQQLNLSFNAVHAIYNSSFFGLGSLTVLGLKNATIYHIANGAFAMLSKLVFLNLENNIFLKNHPSTLEDGLLEGLDNLRVLLLGGCGIKFIGKDANPFKTLKKLTHLGLERNQMTTLPNFEVLVNLRTLDLSENGLHPWYHPVLDKNYHLVDVAVSNNRIAYLTTAMIQDFSNLKKLDLRNNPFTCDCSFSWNNKKLMRLIDNQSVFCAFPDSTTSLTVKEFIEQNPRCQHLTLVVPLVILFLCLIVILFLTYHFRWHLRYWLFLTRLYLSRNRKIRNNSNANAYTNYMYDAFVSYSSEDRNFVIRLVTMLENYSPFIKLCVYERDFEIGSMISESVLESVAKSRKTLLVISDSYAKSQWCRWESQIAEHHRIFFQNENGEYVDDSLILIKLGPVSESHLTPTLKYLLKTRIYLQWSGEEKKQKVFWEKLRAALAPPSEINENTYL
jgi:Leucine-rich repeat (LRR) protein